MRPLPLTAAVLVLAGLAGCGGGEPAKVGAVAVRATAVAPSTAAAAPKGPVDLLTGIAPRTSAPVVVVKVDGSPLARPYLTGLGKASVVYQELMEGGATRFLSVHTDGLASEVGPVRSVRESDLELLRQYGKVAIASSGGNKGVKRTFAGAARSGRVMDASIDALPSLYRKGALRKDAWNYFVVPSRLAKARPGAVAAKDVGFRFGTAAAGAPVSEARAVFSDISTVDLRWTGKTWQVLQDGQVLAGVAPANVIVQRVPIRSSRYVDVVGNPTPYTVTTGKGDAVLLRDGRRIDGRWARAKESAPTTWTTKAGEPLRLRPGRTWVLLLPTGGSFLSR